MDIRMERSHNYCAELVVVEYELERQLKVIVHIYEGQLRRGGEFDQGPTYCKRWLI